MKDKEIYDTLSNAGFTESEIAHLQQLHRDYVRDTSHHKSDADHRHKFIHWLETARDMIFGESYPEWTIYH